MRVRISVGSSYLAWTPSRFITAKPPISCICTAKSGDTIASIAAARIGVEREIPSKEKAVSAISGLIVTLPGTMATSSNP